MWNTGQRGGKGAMRRRSHLEPRKVEAFLATKATSAMGGKQGFSQEASAARDQAKARQQEMATCC